LDAKFPKIPPVFPESAISRNSEMPLKSK
jgi:hypothetical protein